MDATPPILEYARGGNPAAPGLPLRVAAGIVWTTLALVAAAVVISATRTARDGPAVLQAIGFIGMLALVAWAEWLVLRHRSPSAAWLIAAVALILTLLFVFPSLWVIGLLLSPRNWDGQWLDSPGDALWALAIVAMPFVTMLVSLAHATDAMSIRRAERLALRRRLSERPHDAI